MPEGLNPPPEPGTCDETPEPTSPHGRTCDVLNELPPEEAFAENYFEAREKFLKAAKGVEGVKVYTYPIAANSPYTIDIAYYEATPPPQQGGGLVVHVSGTHGVEGYAGSAIQVDRLRALAAQQPPFAPGVSVVMVHALNPYGMAHYRRWNEHNVDLNRNGMFEESDMAEVLARDPNLVGYEDFNDLYNPQRKPTGMDAYTIFAKSAYYVARFGFLMLKKSLVTGQYHRKEGVFYGGNQIQPSYVILRRFFEETGLRGAVGAVQVVDVHTGLGPCGVDTLLHAEAAENVAGVEARFAIDAASAPHSKIEGLGAANGQAAAGYELMKGGTIAAFAYLFPQAGQLYQVTQEFGTLSGIFVARALILENMGYHFDKPHHAYWAKYTRDAFYVRTPEWREAVRRRGEVVFRQAVDGVAAASSRKGAE
eukprot:TRINITY_DN455_c0_g2_i2.p1 TRINITY_DN455_c0_g2~~TRINITY_DN455_c0_g2_i2.p1  ORF type:complete len:423 (+),score=144.67 TRINITY_DN455_c0_g2_i2:66-1334(+)